MKLLVALTIWMILDCCYCTPSKRRDQDAADVPPHNKEEQKTSGKANTYSIGGGFNIKRKQGINVGPRNNLFHIGYETETKVGAHAHVGAGTAAPAPPRPNSAPLAPVNDKVATKNSKPGRGCFSGKLFCSVKVSDVRTPRPVSGHSVPSNSNSIANSQGRSNFNSNSNLNSFHSSASKKVSDVRTPEYSISNSNSFYSATSRKFSGVRTPEHSISNSNSFYSATS